VQVFNGTITVSSIDQNSCATAECGSILHAIPRDFGNDSWRPRKFVTRPFSCSEHRTGLMRNLCARASQTGTKIPSSRWHAGARAGGIAEDYFFFRHLLELAAAAREWDV
jgi:hypothetical protein